MSKIKTSKDEVAIIGMAGRFPGAKDLAEYWQNIESKNCSIINFSDQELLENGVSLHDLNNPNYIKSKGYLADADMFDADFFKFSRCEAEQLDPQFRIFLEESFTALKSAGYISENYLGKIGVFAGASNIDSYFSNNLLQNTRSSLSADNFTKLLYNAKDFLSSHVAYKLNLKGPAVTVQTACSSSLVSVITACRSILGGDADMAIAGGVSVTTPLKSGYSFQEGMMLSPTGRCRPFDENADGIVVGNGCGVVVLKKLSEALKHKDRIYAVIKGAAINHDGNSKIGFTAPGVSGQASVLREALKNAELSPEDISYIEAHGTGTVLGDLIEFESLNEVYSNTSRPNKIMLGAVKSNIGHLDAASGIAGLIKTVLALNKEKLPANASFNNENPRLNFSSSPFEICKKPQRWGPEGCSKYAGVSSFGIGGTNTHIILGQGVNADDVFHQETCVFNRKKYWKEKNEVDFLGYKTLASASSGIKSNLKKTDIKEIESAIKKIFEKILFKDHVDVNTTFDEIGGESFSALLIMHEINKSLGLKVPISVLDKNLTIKILSYVVASHVENR